MVPVEVPAATAAPAEVSADLAAVVAPPMAGLNQALADPSVTVDLGGVASGTALTDLGSEQLEFQQQGLHQVGSIEVASAEVTQDDPAAAPPTLVVKVCLDRSAVRVLDANGKDVTNAAAQPRVLQIWTMQSVDGAWKLTDRTFADELAC